MSKHESLAANASSRQATRKSSSAAPLVSVCMPVRNQAAYVGLAIDSVLKQTMPDFELLVIDDASSDGSWEVVQAKPDKRLVPSRRITPGGAATVRNQCLEAARGEFIAWLDADDLYEPDALETLTQVLQAFPGASMVHGAFTLIDSAGAALPTWRPPFSDDTIEPGMAAFAELSLSNYVTTSTAMARMRAVQESGPFVADIGPSSTDWNMWLRLALHGDVVYRSRNIASYRRHPNSITATTDNDQRLLCDQRAVEHALRQATGLDDLRRRALYAQAFRWLLRSGEHLREGRRTRALVAATKAWRLAGRDMGWSTRSTWMQVFSATLLGNEYSCHLASKQLMRRLHLAFQDTRYGYAVQKLALLDAEWLAEAYSVAASVKASTEWADRIAVIDKHDPTILHYSERRGCHFPEVRGLSKGAYPTTSDQAIEHVEELRRQGIDYLVIPASAFWWLDFYSQFREHLNSRYDRTVNDDHVVIFALSEAGSRQQTRNGASHVAT